MKPIMIIAMVYYVGCWGSDAGCFAADRLGIPRRTGKGWASVLNTHLSRGRMESSENNKYKYLSVSAIKKDCWTSSFTGGSLYTSLIPEYPFAVLQCFSSAYRYNLIIKYMNKDVHRSFQSPEPVLRPIPIPDISDRAWVSKDKSRTLLFRDAICTACHCLLGWRTVLSR